MGLDFRLGRRQFPGYHLIGETHTAMAAVAKRLIRRVPTAAQRDHCPAGKAEGGAGGIVNFEFALDTDGAIVITGNFGCGHSLGW